MPGVHAFGLTVAADVQELWVVVLDGVIRILRVANAHNLERVYRAFSRVIGGHCTQQINLEGFTGPVILGYDEVERIIGIDCLLVVAIKIFVCDQYVEAACILTICHH